MQPRRRHERMVPQGSPLVESPCCCHGLDTCAAHVVEGVLLGEASARGLRVGTQRERLGVLGVKLLHDLGPEHTRGTHLGNLHEVVHTDSPEERQTGCKGIDVDTGIDTGTEVLETVGKGVGELNVGRSTSFLHVVARDGDAVELGHIL